ANILGERSIMNQPTINIKYSNTMLSKASQPKHPIAKPITYPSKWRIEPYSILDMNFKNSNVTSSLAPSIRNKSKISLQFTQN
ncbi:hypothetical protein Q8G48_28520, partial [Klebsiella pneumoniae]|uniref:hypothetical protein n=1 Tax=Klebsiella pneumoniae TaxID=573 RepID=UPI003013C4A1